MIVKSLFIFFILSPFVIAFIDVDLLKSARNKLRDAVGRANENLSRQEYSNGKCSTFNNLKAKGPKARGKTDDIIDEYLSKLKDFRAFEQIQNALNF